MRLGASFVALAIACTGCGSQPDEEAAADAQYLQWQREQAEDAAAEERREQRLARDRRIEERLDQAWVDASIQAKVDPSPINLRRRDLAGAKASIFSSYGYLSNGYDCPPRAPVKGNFSLDAADYIYHQPGWLYYGATIPEECFRDAAQARKAGYRPSKVRR